MKNIINPIIIIATIIPIIKNIFPEELFGSTEPEVGFFPFKAFTTFLGKAGAG